MTTHRYTLTERQAELVHAQIASHCQALKNWTASAVETGDTERAQRLVAELREHERLFAMFNVAARRALREAGR